MINKFLCWLMGHQWKEIRSHTFYKEGTTNHPIRRVGTERCSRCGVEKLILQDLTEAKQRVEAIRSKK